jgi:multisubunit Na+/H+ antiporter MnhC subunit
MGHSQRPRPLPRSPLMRLLAINLATGVGMAVLLVGGLLALDPGGLRHLILADRAGGVALALLLTSFVITFGSTAMGTAIMALGRRERKDDRPRGGRKRRAAEATARTGRS